MKKNIIIVMIILVLVGLTILVIEFGKQGMEDNKEGLTVKELDSMEYVDKKVEKLVDSEEYKNMSLEEKIVKTEELLKTLKEEKHIRNYDYSSRTYSFNFIYKSGVLGGIKLKEFHPMFN